LYIPGPYFMDAMVGAYKAQICERLQIDSTTFATFFSIPNMAGILCGPFGAVISTYGASRTSLLSGVFIMLSSMVVVVGLDRRAYYLVLLGRLVFWLTLYIMCTIQSVVVYKLFTKGALPTAYGFVILACRVGGILGYFASGFVLDWVHGNVVSALWVSVGFVSFAAIATMLVPCLRSSETARLVRPLLESEASSGQATLGMQQQLRRFPASCWIMLAQIGLLYGAVFPFEAIAVDYFEKQWDLDPTSAGFIISFAPSLALFAPLYGKWMNTTRRLAVVNASGWVCLAVSMMMFAIRFPRNPLYAVLIFGLGYALSSTTAWVLLPRTLCGRTECQTAATAFAYASLALAQALSNEIAGILHDLLGYPSVCLMFLCMQVVGLSLALKTLAAQREGILDAEDEDEDGGNDVSLDTVNGDNGLPEVGEYD